LRKLLRAVDNNFSWNMRKIIYYVASSLDGFISGPHADISRFVGEGNGVAQYLSDLNLFDTVIMGKGTYEFGYKFGLQPGQPAYPHMKHYIFSNTLAFERCDPQVKVCPVDIAEVRKIQADPGTDIYLCGGGILAGWLLDHGLIDEVKLKLNPIVLGDGVPLFGNSTRAVNLELQSSSVYDKGLQIMSYAVRY